VPGRPGGGNGASTRQRADGSGTTEGTYVYNAGRPGRHRSPPSPPNSKSRMEKDPPLACFYASCLCISSPGTLSAAGAPPRHHLHYHRPRAAGVNSAAQAGGGHHMCSQDCLLRLSSCSCRQYFKSPLKPTLIPTLFYSRFTSRWHLE
jgi:hypothetical protein